MAITRLAIILLLAGSVSTAFSQKQEIGLTLGRLFSQDRDFSGGRLSSSSGTAWQANYGYRIAKTDNLAVYLQTHFLANPLRTVTAPNPLASRDYASLYLTPGIRVKFAPDARVTPWAETGFGYALHEHSTTRLDGRPNDAPRLEHGNAFTFGGGVDVRVFRWLAFRGELRDIYATSPNYNVTGVGGRQHNVVAGGGFVLRFGE